MNDQKNKTVTVPVEFVRLAIIMRQRQRRFFSRRDPADIPPAKKSEAEFDKMLAEISKGLQAMKVELDNPSQDALL